MIILDSTTKQLEISLSATPSVAFNWVSNWVNMSNSTFVPVATSGTVSSSATIISPPGSGEQIQVKFLSIYNASIGDNNVTINYNNNSVISIIGKYLLNSGDTLYYIDSHGFYIMDSSGSIKTGLVGPIGGIGPTGSTGGIGPTGPSAINVTVSGGKNTLTTDSYLRGTDSQFMNLVPFILPFNASLVNISASTNGSMTWIAEVHNNSIAVSGATLSISSTSSGYGTYSVSFSEGDMIMLYCNGTSINEPRIDIIFNKI